MTAAVNSPNAVEHEQEALRLLEWTRENFGTDVVLTSSFGADSSVMLHLCHRVIPETRIVMLDTGYLFRETYQYAERLRREIGFDLRTYTPRLSAAALEALHGPLWEGEAADIKRYLQIVKVEPLDRALAELKPRAWLAGLRADQTEHRSELKPVEFIDPFANKPRAGEPQTTSDMIAKVLPILNWTREQVAEYMDRYDLPRHPLVARGYLSIGDVHSTFPTTPDDPRGGRRLGEKRECGIHLHPRGRALGLSPSL